MTDTMSCGEATVRLLERYGVGKSWGVLHEITEQKAVTAPLTALSASTRSAGDGPELMAQAFSIFASERPRPVHISIPVDILEQPVDGEWETVSAPRVFPRRGRCARCADPTGRESSRDCHHIYCG